MGWGRFEPRRDGLARSLRSLRELRLAWFKLPTSSVIRSELPSVARFRLKTMPESIAPEEAIDQ